VGRRGGALIIREVYDGTTTTARELLWTRDLASGLTIATCSVPDDDVAAAERCEVDYRKAGAALAWSDVAQLTGNEPLVPCARGLPDPRGVATLEVRGEAIRVAFVGESLVVSRGKHELRRALPSNGDMPGPRLQLHMLAAFAGPASVGVLVDVANTVQSDEDPDAPPGREFVENRLYEFTGYELGLEDCIAASQGPAPGNDKPLALDLATRPPDADGCIAMTADGRKAAFILRDDYEHPLEESPTRHAREVQWVGPGDEPALDLSCLAKSCSGDVRKKLEAKAQSLGLVGCPSIAADDKPRVILGGLPRTLSIGRDGAMVELGDGFLRHLGKFPLPIGDEGLNATTVHQLGGGPIYVAWERRDSVSRNTGVEVYSPDALRFCAEGATPAPLVEP
jgi:hypothetical protein